MIDSNVGNLAILKHPQSLCRTLVKCVGLSGFDVGTTWGNAPTQWNRGMLVVPVDVGPSTGAIEARESDLTPVRGRRHVDVGYAFCASEILEPALGRGPEFWNGGSVSLEGSGGVEIQFGTKEGEHRTYELLLPDSPPLRIRSSFILHTGIRDLYSRLSKIRNFDEQAWAIRLMVNGRTWSEFAAEPRDARHV